MKVILTQTVPKVGKEGSVLNVADGFARNYLFPRGLAIIADKNQIKALGKRNEKIAAKLATLKTDADALKEKLDGIRVKLGAKVGSDQGKLFGAITNADIANAIKEQTGISLDKKQVALIDPIKRLGVFPIHLDLHREVDAHIEVEIFDPQATVESAKAEEVVTA